MSERSTAKLTLDYMMKILKMIQIDYGDRRIIRDL